MNHELMQTSYSDRKGSHLIVQCIKDRTWTSHTKTRGGTMGVAVMGQLQMRPSPSSKNCKRIRL